MSKNAKEGESVKEKDKHREAFEIYYSAYSISRKQSDGIEAVMKHCKISNRTAYRWLESFDWNYKAMKRDEAVDERVEQITVNTLANNKKNYLDYIHGLINTAVEDIQSGKLRVKSAFELKELIKVALLLQDEPTDNLKVKIESQEEIEKELDEYGDVFELVALQDQVTADDRPSGRDN